MQNEGGAKFYAPIDSMVLSMISKKNKKFLAFNKKSLLYLPY